LKTPRHVPGTALRKGGRLRIACLMMLCAAAAVSASAQAGGTSAGGKWMMFQSEDKMTAAKRIRFELEADNPLRESESSPKIILYCTDGKLALGDFRPNLRVGPPNDASFWGKPKMRVRVRVDNHSSRQSWNWVNGDFLAMDKGTVRELIGARVFKVEFPTRAGPRIAEFSPAGLDLAQVSKACHLKPQKP